MQPAVRAVLARLHQACAELSPHPAALAAPEEQAEAAGAAARVRLTVLVAQEVAPRMEAVVAVDSVLAEPVAALRRKAAGVVVELDFQARRLFLPWVVAVVVRLVAVMVRLEALV